ncbi:uncharacterized protein LOC126077927 [Elephas maximus indicus]|uniref:uncharacterized protein LOC126077927 n=1 Tax=Elephas maximus indicus TaxID=99487 RepID=UPI0021162420|nr:uncharacterized protein LOC126077927 [Elephas maximus indicus]
MTEKYQLLTPEPGEHLPSEGEAQDNQLPSSPAEPEGQRWSQETSHDDSETLSHQSESQSDIKTDPSESSSTTESLPSDPPPRSSPLDREAYWVCLDAPAPQPPQAHHSARAPGLDPEEVDLCPDLKQESCTGESQVLAAATGEEKAEHLWDDVIIPESEPPIKSLLAGAPPHPWGHSQDAPGSSSLQLAKVVTEQDHRGFSAFSLQKSKSQSCLGVPMFCPFHSWGCDLGQNWPHIYERTGGPVFLYRDSLDTTSPVGTRTKKRKIPSPAEDTDVLMFQPCWPPLGTSCLLHAKLGLSAPENIDGKGWAPTGHHYPHTRTPIRAHSIACFPLRDLVDPPGVNVLKFGTHFQGGVEAEGDPTTQNTLHAPPAQLFHSLSASHSRTPYLKNLYKPSFLSLKEASQDLPPGDLQLENQLGQDSRMCQVPSCLAPELVNVSLEEVPVEFTFEPSPEHRSEKPQDTHPAPKAADVSDRQKHLPDVDAGNHASNHTSKHVPNEKRKPSIKVKFTHDSSGNGTQVWDRDFLGCPEVNDCAGALQIPQKPRRTQTLKEAEKAIVLEPGCTKDARQSISAITTASECDCGSGCEECEHGDHGHGLAGGARILAACPQLDPRARMSSRSKCALIIITVEQKGLQATRRKVDPLLEAQSRESLEELGPPCSAHPVPCAFPKAGKAQSGDKPELPATPQLGTDDEASEPPTEAADLGIVLVPRAAEENTLSRADFSEKTCFQDRAWRALSTDDPWEEKLLGANQSSGTRGDSDHVALAPGPRPGVSAPPPGPEEAHLAEVLHPDGGRGEGIWLKRNSAGDKDASTLACAPPRRLHRRPQDRGLRVAVHKLRKAGVSGKAVKLLVFPKMTSFRKNNSSAAEPPDGRFSSPGGAGTKERTSSGPESAPWVGQGSCAEDSSEDKHQTAEHLRGAASEQRADAAARTPSYDVGQSTSPHEAFPSTGDASGLTEVGDVETPRHCVSRKASSESCPAKRLRTPEKTFRARLALAHKTFSNFFESKVLEKESLDECSPCSLKGGEAKNRPHHSSRCALLRSTDAEGPNRPVFRSQVPGQKTRNPLGPSSPAKDSHCEGQARNSESCVAVRDHRALLHSPTLALSPSYLVSTDSRRKSEPTINCTDSQVGGGYQTSGIFPEKSWLAAASSTSAQQARSSSSLPSHSVRLLAYESQGLPCKPLSPKPQSPHSLALWRDLPYSGRGSTISMVSLGSYSDMDGSSEVPERPKMPKTGTGLLLSLQSLDQGDQEEGRRRGQCHHGLDVAPSARGLPAGECWKIITSPECLNHLRRNHSFSQSAPMGLNHMSWPNQIPNTGESHAFIFCYILGVLAKRTKVGRCC